MKLLLIFMFLILNSCSYHGQLIENEKSTSKEENSSFIADTFKYSELSIISPLNEVKPFSRKNGLEWNKYYDQFANPVNLVSENEEYIFYVKEKNLYKFDKYSLESKLIKEGNNIIQLSYYKDILYYVDWVQKEQNWYKTLFEYKTSSDETNIVLENVGNGALHLHETFLYLNCYNQSTQKYEFARYNLAEKKIEFLGISCEPSSYVFYEKYLYFWEGEYTFKTYILDFENLEIKETNIPQWQNIKGYEDYIYYFDYDINGFMRFDLKTGEDSVICEINENFRDFFITENYYIFNIKNKILSVINRINKTNCRITISDKQNANVLGIINDEYIVIEIGNELQLFDMCGAKIDVNL